MFIIKPKSEVIAERNLNTRIDLFLHYLSLDLEVTVSFEGDQIFIVGKAEARARFIERLMNNKPPLMSVFYSLSEANIKDDFAAIDITILED